MTRSAFLYKDTIFFLLRYLYRPRPLSHRRNPPRRENKIVSTRLVMSGLQVFAVPANTILLGSMFPPIQGLVFVEPSRSYLKPPVLRKQNGLIPLTTIPVLRITLRAIPLHESHTNPPFRERRLNAPPRLLPIGTIIRTPPLPPTEPSNTSSPTPHHRNVRATERKFTETKP